MRAQDNGGPAFPINELDQFGEQLIVHNEGMSMRDYFMAAAINGICAHRTTWTTVGMTDEEIISKSKKLAELALKARQA